MSNPKRKKSATETIVIGRRAMPFRFLDLPAEIRCMVYELALGDSENTGLVSRTKDYRRTVLRIVGWKFFEWYGTTNWKGKWREFQRHGTTTQRQAPHLMPHILLINKQIHSEAIGFLYRRPIQVDNLYTLHTFLTNIGHANRPRLRSIIVREWGSRYGDSKPINHAALALLADCPHLQRVVLDYSFRHHFRTTPQSIARIIYRDGHMFFEAYGAAHKRRDAAVDILELSPTNFVDTPANDRRRGFNARGTADFKGDPDKVADFEDELRRLLLR